MDNFAQNNNPTKKIVMAIVVLAVLVVAGYALYHLYLAAVADATAKIKEGVTEGVTEGVGKGIGGALNPFKGIGGAFKGGN